MLDTGDRTGIELRHIKRNAILELMEPEGDADRLNAAVNDGHAPTIT
ncbi:hypothetical protein COLAER_02098 [Collinsella aerofaciens ATCC 25986]|uniref:Uncharacterized protein n=1 Tax=Collinsella aerofaciens (strain ATCC 25986 / DSM 3979 / JCM 10188 / KCTC 3647 / NCTC 11838 / VPI 1003) TaxID=411903 RepID=A4ECB9_COLAA|nr:hypothetical protein COLAER_02098 [Collinsella aerofaciens ATCC 25986]